MCYIRWCNLPKMIGIPENEIWWKSYYYWCFWMLLSRLSYYTSSDFGLCQGLQPHGMRVLSVVPFLNFVLTSLSLRLFGLLYATSGGLLNISAIHSFDWRKFQYFYIYIYIYIANFILVYLKIAVSIRQILSWSWWV